MPTDKLDVERLQTAVAQTAVANSLRSHWHWFLLEGIVLLLLGVAAIGVPQVATIAAAALIGWLLLASGVIGLATTLRMRSAPGFGWSIMSAFLGIVAGIVLLMWPLSGALSLTLILTVFLVIEGIASILFSLDHRRESTRRWGAMLFSGIVDLVLAGMIFLGLPASAAWAIGLLVGINLVFGGSALMSIALTARTAAVPGGLGKSRS